KLTGEYIGSDDTRAYAHATESDSPARVTEQCGSARRPAGHADSADRIEIHIRRLAQGGQQMWNVPTQADECLGNGFLVMLDIVPVRLEAGRREDEQRAGLVGRRRGWPSGRGRCTAARSCQHAVGWASPSQPRNSRGAARSVTRHQT